MVVADDQDIDFRTELEDAVCPVAAALFIILGIEADMGCDDDYIHLVLDDVHHLAGSRADRSVDERIGLLSIPAWCVGIGQADKADLDARSLDDGIRLCSHGSVDPGQVRRQNREVGKRLQPPNEILTEVELVVAQRHGIVLEQVHRTHDRVLPLAFVIQVVGHDVALDGIAVVDQDHIVLLFSHLLYIGGDPCHAGVGGVLVILITETPHIAMQIGGSQNDEVLRTGYLNGWLGCQKTQ